MKRLLAVLAALFTVGATLVATATSADAATTCGPLVYINAKVGYAAYCPVWGTPVPVYGNVSGTPGPTHTVVDHLYNGGDSNWFICREDAWSYSHDGYTSSNWAETYGDNGKLGWANAVYFDSSLNYWAGLPICGG